MKSVIGIDNYVKDIKRYLNNPDKFVYPFTIKEKSGKERTIITYNKFGNYGPSLRYAHEKINELFKVNFSERNINSFAYHKNIRCLDALTSHLRSSFFIKLDIHQFFESIKEETFFLHYGHLFFNNWKTVIKGLFYKGSLSIGFVTSPTISDFYMKDFDEAVASYLSNNPKLHYSRYSDDILLSSEEDNDASLEEFYTFIVNKLKEFDLTTNDKKLKKIKLDLEKHNSISFLGLNISKEDEINNKITISKRYILFLLFLIEKQKGYQDHCYALDNEIKSRIAYLAYNSPISYHRFQKKYMNKYGEPYSFVPKMLEKRSVGNTTSEIPDYSKYTSLFKINIHQKISPTSHDGLGIVDAIEIEKYLGKEKDVVEIPPFVDSIGERAFANSDVKKVILNNKLKNIEQFAFHHSKLEEISFPDSLRYIGDAAFMDCTNLRSDIVLPPHLKRINSRTFNLTGIKKITFNDELETISGRAFLYNNIEELIFPASLKNIDNNAFGDSSSLKKIVFNEGLESIGNSAFIDCPLLTEINTPNTLLSIGMDAFRNARSLGKVYISPSVIEIGVSAFSNCPSLKEIEIDPNNKVYIPQEDKASIITSNKQLLFSLHEDIKEGVLHIGASSFRNRLLKEIKVPEGVLTIGEGTFANMPLLKKVILPSSLVYIGPRAFSNCVSLEEITLPEGITTIEESLFMGCINLKKVHMSEKVTSIGKMAFSTCYSYVIDIPKGVTSIGQYAYLHCKNNKELYIPENVRHIYKDAFLGVNKYLTSIKVAPLNVNYSSFNDTNTIVDIKKAKVILGCKNSIISEGIRTIYKYAFAYVEDLKELILPSTLREIKEGAFIGCTSLEKVNLNNVNIIAKDAFKGCKTLKELILPASLTTLGDEALKGTSITSLSLPNSLTKITNESFKGLDYLEELYLPHNFYFSPKIFQGLSFPHLKKITVDPHNDKYDSRDNCNALIVTESNSLVLGSGSTIIPEGIERIYAGAFKDNLELTLIEIPLSIVMVNEFAFERCSNLKRVKFVGSPSFGGDIFKYCTSLDEIDFYGDNYDEIIPAGMFTNCTSLKTIKLPENINSIGAFCFLNCTSLEEVILGNNLTSISYDAFRNCSSLQHIDLPDSVEVINSGAFASTKLEEIILPPNLANLEGSLFEGCSSLKKVILNDALKVIANGAFKDCVALEEIHIPSGVKTIQSNAFEGCTSLNKINLPDDIQEIRAYTFYNCVSLKEIDIPHNVISIGNSAFEGCVSLKMPTLHEGIEDIGAASFKDVKCDTISLPSTLLALNNNAFRGSGFMNIKIKEGGSFFVRDNSLLYHDKDKQLHLFLATSTSKIPTGTVIIDECAFYDVQDLKEIVIPEGVTRINASAFFNCTSLEKVSLPSSLLVIESNAFSNCINLKDIKLNEGIKIISIDAFKDIHFKKLHIPASLISIAVEGLSFDEIVIDKSNRSYSDFDSNILASKDGIVYKTSSLSKIPSSITSIKAGCYSDMKIDKIIIPEGIDSLEGSFRNLGDVEELYLPASLKDKLNGFGVGTYFKKIIISPANPYLVTDGNSIYNSEGDRLYYLGGENGIIKEGIRTIFNDIFNPHLTSINIPASLDDNISFAHIKKDHLTSISIDKENPYFYESNGNVITLKDKSLIFMLKGASIDEEVERISQFAFKDNNIKHFYLPKNVKYIESRALTYLSQNELESIVVDKDNSIFDSRSDCNALIITASNKALLTCKNTVLLEGIVKVEAAREIIPTLSDKGLLVSHKTVKNVDPLDDDMPF